MRGMEKLAALMAALMITTPAFAGGESDDECRKPCEEQERPAEPIGFETAKVAVQAAIGEIDKLDQAVTDLQNNRAGDRAAAEEARKKAEEALALARSLVGRVDGHDVAIQLMMEQLDDHQKTLEFLLTELAKLDVRVGVLEYRADQNDENIAALESRTTSVEGDHVYMNVLVGGGLQLTEPVTGVVNSANGIGNLGLEISHRSNLGEITSWAQGGIHVPSGRKIGLGAAYLFRLHDHFFLGPDLVAVEYSYRMGGNSYEDGLGADRRMGNSQGMEFGLMGRVPFTPADEPVQVGFVGRFNGGLTDNWNVYDFEHRSLGVSFAPEGYVYIGGVLGRRKAD